MKRMFKRGTCFLLALVICAGVLPTLGISASAATLEERQQAAMAVAFAYFDKGHSVQYEGSQVNNTIHRSDLGKTRSTNGASPEFATPHETVYTVCSDYAHQVYYEAFGYELGGNAGTVWTRYLARESAKDPACVWYFAKDEGKNLREELDKMIAMAQPGDILTEYAINGGHTMIWAGDVTGDGKPDIIHSGGRHMNKKKQIDKIEQFKEYDEDFDPRYEYHFGGDSTKGGSIRIGDANDYIDKNCAKVSRRWISLLRPAKVLTEQNAPIPAKTLYRMSHPRLAIDRTMNKNRFTTAVPGEPVTLTLTLSNSSTQDYTVTVTEKVPVGAAIKRPFADATVADGVMTFDVELKAGAKKTMTAEYEITAAFGETVTFGGSFVGDIPSNTIPVRVSGAKLTAEERVKLAKVAVGEYDQALADAKADNATLGDAVYQNVLGLKVRIPDFKTVTTKFTKVVKTPKDRMTNVFVTKDEVAAEDMTAYNMMVQTCWGGFSMWTPRGHDRCSRPLDMYLEPGDVIVRSQNILSAEIAEQMVYLGGGKYLTYDAKTNTYPIVEEPEFFRSIFYRIFYVLRPAQAYEDMHKLTEIPAAKPTLSKFAFTDVPANAWYYSYVKDLVDHGTISGMTETTFDPNGTLTYGQALKLIATALAEKEPAKSGEHWASGYLTLAKELKWLEGDVDLDKPITRLALCQIAAKAQYLTDQPSKNPFTDTKDKGVLSLVEFKIINGMTETTFEPDGLLTRAQIAKIIWSMIGV